MILEADSIFAIKKELYAQKRHNPNVTIDEILSEIKLNFEKPAVGTPEMVKNTIPRWTGSSDAFVTFVDTMLMISKRFYHDKEGAKALFFGMQSESKLLADRLYFNWQDISTYKLSTNDLDKHIDEIISMKFVEYNRFNDVVYGNTYTTLSRNELVYRMKHVNMCVVLQAIIDDTYRITGWENFNECLAKNMVRLCTEYPDESTRELAKRALVKMIDNYDNDEKIYVYPLDAIESSELAKDDDVNDALKRWCMR
jgi:hypothetical protein